MSGIKKPGVQPPKVKLIAFPTPPPSTPLERMYAARAKTDKVIARLLERLNCGR